MEGTISKKALILWEIFAFLIAMAVGWAIFVFVPLRSILWYSSLWILGLLLVLCEFLYLPLRYENEKYLTNENYIEYQRGFFVFARTRILKRTILYVQVIRTPFSALLRTRTLMICSMGARMVIPFVPFDQAEALLKDITPRHPALQPRLFEKRSKNHE